MNGAESLVRTLVANDVNICFTNPGTSEMHYVAALDKVEGMRWMAMANQYYRNRPGITAAGAALANQKHSAYPVPTTQVSTTSVSDGFNWSDAGIGASISFGAALLLLTAVGLGRRSRSRGLASV